MTRILAELLAAARRPGRNAGRDCLGLPGILAAQLVPQCRIQSALPVDYTAFHHKAYLA